MGITDTIFKLVTVVKFAIIVLSATMFLAINILSSQIMVTRRFQLNLL
jgi:hypothetical protein